MNVFLNESITELSKCLSINKYAMDFKRSKQLPYGLIYSLKIIELKNFKINIETNLANSFI